MAGAKCVCTCLYIQKTEFMFALLINRRSFIEKEVMRGKKTKKYRSSFNTVYYIIAKDN